MLIAWEIQPTSAVDEIRADDMRSRDVNSALIEAANSGENPSGEHFQVLVAHHHRWITDQWGGHAPNRDAYAGLVDLYISDERFADYFGGQRNAENIRDAMMFWIAVNLD